MGRHLFDQPKHQRRARFRCYDDIDTAIAFAILASGSPDWQLTCNVSSGPTLTVGGSSAKCFAIASGSDYTGRASQPCRPICGAAHCRLSVTGGPVPAPTNRIVVGSRGDLRQR
jgi:hypothetical protein